MAVASSSCSKSSTLVPVVLNAVFTSPLFVYETIRMSLSALLVKPTKYKLLLSAMLSLNCPPENTLPRSSCPVIGRPNDVSSIGINGSTTSIILTVILTAVVSLGVPLSVT